MDGAEPPDRRNRILGFVGWLADHWLKTGGIAIGIGCVLGAAAGVFLTMRRLGA
jgi:F0F1-type ATP synthase assembly protein I